MRALPWRSGGSYPPALMKYSLLFAPTLRDDPADAEVVSHKLLLRAGYIRRVTSGVYDYLPLGLMMLRKVEAIVREEMNRAGAQELLMPMVQPAELWQKSGRWEKYGRELLRFADRHDHESCLGPTHEEVICDLVSRELRSYRQLPLNLYQIQGKFRDEVRPRFGLMRGREFVMKDAYSFHETEEDLRREYRNMYDTYCRIFSRLGLKFRAVEADTGSIGGKSSHEFHVLADSGEDLIAHCQSCDYAANVEMAESRRSSPVFADAPLYEVATPGITAADAVAAALGLPVAALVKTMLYRVVGGTHDGEIVAVCMRGGDQVQEVKLQRQLGATGVALASEAEISAVGGIVGYVGPQGLRCLILADLSLRGAVGMVVGANRAGHHTTGFSFTRDLGAIEWADLRTASPGDHCPRCNGTIDLSRGIEVGHAFALGRAYSEPMGVAYQGRDGKREVAVMGCYGIGVSRLVAAIVEQCNDANGIAWPTHLAPFTVALIGIGKSEAAQAAVADLYAQLNAAGIATLFDDRNERPGVKFRDAELMGLPIHLVVGDRALERGMIEIKQRGGEASEVELTDALAVVRALIG